MYLYVTGPNGNFWFDKDEVAFTINQQSNENERGVLQSVTHTWNVSGIRHGDDASDVTDRLAELQTALVNGSSVGFYENDQATLTNHYLPNSRALGGVRFMNFNFPQPDGAEYTTYRTYSFQIQAVYPQTNTFLVNFREELAFEGNGGPLNILLPVLLGPPQGQQVTQRTPYRCVQSGFMLTYGSWGTAPQPIWPAYQINPGAGVTYVSPTVQGKQLNQFELRWRYLFESSNPLIGYPHFA